MNILDRIQVVQSRQDFRMCVPPQQDDTDVVLEDCRKEIESLRQQLAAAKETDLLLRSLLCVIHISGWAPIYRTVIPEYSWGEGADVPKPQSTKASDAERMRKIRKDPEYRWKELMQKRAKRSRERKVVSDWWETRRVKHAG